MSSNPVCCICAEPISCAVIVPYGDDDDDGAHVGCLYSPSRPVRVRVRSLLGSLHDVVLNVPEKMRPGACFSVYPVGRIKFYLFSESLIGARVIV